MKRDMQLIDGKATATAIKAEIAEEVKEIVAKGGKQPHLAAVLVGHDGGSETYVKNKVLACEACGFKSTLIRFEDNITEEELLACVDNLNRNGDIDGFIVQLPLPKHIDEQKIIEAIDYRKDVDGFHPINVGRMAIGLPCFISATPLGIITLLKRYNIETSGKKCVILGRSNIVGKPMAQLMMQKKWGDATVTVCHSRSKTLKEECLEADIINQSRKLRIAKGSGTKIEEVNRLLKQFDQTRKVMRMMTGAGSSKMAQMAAAMKMRGGMPKF